MSFSAAAAAVIVLIAVGCWRQAKNPKLKFSMPERMAGYTYSVYFILLAAMIFLSGISLVLAAKASSIAAAVLLAIGLLGKKHSRDLAYIDFNFRRTPRLQPRLVEPRLAEFEKLFAGDIILLAIALGLTSAVVWAIFLLRRP